MKISFMIHPCPQISDKGGSDGERVKNSRIGQKSSTPQFPGVFPNGGTFHFPDLKVLNLKKSRRKKLIGSTQLGASLALKYPARVGLIYNDKRSSLLWYGRVLQYRPL
jgi:hypothetical protein